MKGVRLLVHAVRQVTGNFSEALKISAVLYLASQAAILGVSYAVLGDVTGELSMTGMAPDNPYVEADAEAAITPAVAWPAFLVTGVVWGIAAAWIAVRWHRFVLLEEHPGGAIPLWSGALVWAYVVRSIKIVLVVFAIAVALLLAVQVMLTLLPDVMISLVVIGGLLAGVLLLALPLRIGLGLPAAALGGRMSTSESWRATAPAWGSILVLAVAMALLGYVLSLPLAVPGLPVALLLALSLVVGWIQLMVSVAVLTTLYGHLVEGREIR